MPPDEIRVPVEGILLESIDAAGQTGRECPMVDQRIRTAERRWRTDRADQAELARLILELRRAGRRVPTGLLDACVFSPIDFSSRLILLVEAERPTGAIVAVGTTGDSPVRIPKHRTWWVGPLVHDERLTPVLTEVRERRLPGLALRERRVAEKELLRAGDSVVALDLRGSHLPQGLGSLRHAPRLQRLDLSEARRYDLRKLPALDELVMLRLDVPDYAGPPTLPPSLCRLSLAFAVVEPFVACLAKLRSLTHLDLNRAIVSTRSARAIARCEGLQHLNLESAKVTAEALAELAEGTPSLESLVLGRVNGITDEGLGAIARMRSLRALNLDHLPPAVTSEGLGVLTSLTNLRKLYLRGPKRMKVRLAAGLEALASELTDCKIY